MAPLTLVRVSSAFTSEPCILQCGRLSLLAMGGERYWISLVDIVVLVVEVCFPVSPSVRLWCWVVVLLVMASPPKT